jgi:TolB-like protein
MKSMNNMKQWLLTVVLALISALVYAQERIAVFPFEDMDKVFKGNEAVMFYREFSNEFTNKSAGRFSVVPRQEVDKLINTEAAFQLNDFSARAKTAEMQRVLNGTQILSGLIGKLGNNIRITVSLYTYPELQQLPGGTTVSVANTTDLFNKIPELVQQMQDRIAGTDQPIPEGLKYEVVDNKSFTITGYTGTATTVNIPSRIASLPVTVIAYRAFWGCFNLTSVTIPASVTTIGDDAFGGCNITSITIPSSVTSIGDSAFYDCDSLTSITIPASVTSIGNGAFFDCDSLTSITVDSRNPAYASVDGVLFDKNIRTLIHYPRGRKQTTYVIPSSVTTIGKDAFCRSSLTSITIPPSVTSIGNYAFYDCRLTSVTIPSSVTSIEDDAFYNSESLTSVTLSRRTQVGERAFPESTRVVYRD